jgi:hypothetical protein
MIGTKHITEVMDSSNRVVGERSVGLGRRIAKCAGGIGNENAGMSMRKRG